MLCQLRVLTVVDHPEDAEPLMAELSRGGILRTWQWVWTETDFVAALETPPDLVLLKRNHALLNAERVHELMRSRNLQTPVIGVASDAGRESHISCREFFEQAALGMCHLDLQGNFTQVNQRLCEITGYRADELMRLSYRELTHADDMAAEAALYEQLLDGATLHGHFVMEKRYVRRDGGATWVSEWMWLLRHAAGEPLGIAGVIEPIRERKDLLTLEMAKRAQMEETLQEHHELQASINRLMMNREKRVIELKEEVNHLCAELNRPPAYPPVW